MIEVRQTTVENLTSHQQFAEAVSAYADECSIQGMPRPKFDLEIYKLLERSGRLKVFSAEEGEELIGFVSVLVTPLPHYSEHVSTTESYYVKEEHRGGGVGERLLSAAKEAARTMGAVGFIVSAPKNGVLAAKLEKDENFKETNRIFFTSLK